LTFVGIACCSQAAHSSRVAKIKPTIALRRFGEDGKGKDELLAVGEGDTDLVAAGLGVSISVVVGTASEVNVGSGVGASIGVDVRNYTSVYF
jgi:hypothetical protein